MSNLQSSLVWKNTDTSFTAEEYSGAGEGELKWFCKTPFYDAPLFLKVQKFSKVTSLPLSQATPKQDQALRQEINAPFINRLFSLIFFKAHKRHSTPATLVWLDQHYHLTEGVIDDFVTMRKTIQPSEQMPLFNLAISNSEIKRCLP